MAVKDLTRWKENADGSWSRKLSAFSEQGVRATAGALEAAHELGVEIGSVTGTGKDGKITKADVEAAVKEA